jgi:hypothetical protein
MRAYPDLQEDAGEWGKTGFTFGVIPGKSPMGAARKDDQWRQRL